VENGDKAVLGDEAFHSGRKAPTSFAQGFHRAQNAESRQSRQKWEAPPAWFLPAGAESR
jgi:hypothetical protein